MQAQLTTVFSEKRKEGRETMLTTLRKISPKQSSAGSHVIPSFGFPSSSSSPSGPINLASSSLNISALRLTMSTKLAKISLISLRERIGDEKVGKVGAVGVMGV